MSLISNIKKYNHRRKQQFVERSCISVAIFGQYNSENAFSFLRWIVLVPHINLTFYILKWYAAVVERSAILSSGTMESLEDPEICLAASFAQTYIYTVQL